MDPRRPQEASWIVVNCDGLCEPRNPGGTATFGWVARRGGELLHQDCGVVAKGPRATNNLAEYTAIIEALRWLDGAGLSGEQIVVRSDSQLAIRQLEGSYDVRSRAILPLWRQAHSLAHRFGRLRFEWVRREANEEADALTRLAYQNSFDPAELAAERAAREQRAALLALRAVPDGPGRWRVPSSSGRGWYSVAVGPESHCSCPDFAHRGVDCKHILAAQRAETESGEEV